MESGGSKPEQSIRKPIIKNYGCCKATGGASCKHRRYWYLYGLRLSFKEYMKEMDALKGRKPKDKK